MFKRGGSANDAFWLWDGEAEYEGHPLYLYAGDSSGRWVQGSGNGADGTWFVVTPDLKPVV